MESFDDRTFFLARLVGRRRSVVVLLLGILLSAAAFTLAPAPTVGSEAGSNLPDDAESSLVQEALADLPGGEAAPAIIVYARDGDTLDEADLEAVRARAEAVGADLGAEAAGPLPSDDGAAALVTVPLPAASDNDENAETVDTLRALAAEDLPDGLTAQVTGAAAVQADLGDVFEGADVRLLAVTAAVVALLLIVTYRSPWLWIVPLAVVGLGDRVAAKAVETVSAWADVPIDGSVEGITSVLVFGAGTNYALLLIARYREELRRVDDRRDAMRRAVGGAAPAILSSSGTVILGLLTLLVADSPFVSRIGLAGAVGLAVAVVFALVLLPAAMTLPGRWLFWPFVPRVGDPDPSERGWWRRVGVRVTRRPTTVLVVGTLVLVAMAAGTLGLRTGLAQDEQFLDTPESILAQRTLQESFPAGLSSPTTVLTSTDRVADVTRTLESSDDVRSVEEGRTDGDVAELRVVLDDAPGSDAALTAVERMRADLADGGTTLVGGPDAQALDEADTAASDRATVVPIVLGVVLVMLLLLLRSVVAAVLLCATTVLSYLSALGVGWLLFDHVLGWSAMDVSTPLLAFIFLVALGVDYNIFLTARAREEMARTGDPTGSIVTALALTGGVITSAGILLAAVFTVLGVLPLVLLAQLGVIVGLGVLLDTVVVRGVVTPALVTLCGRAFWWPSRLSRQG